MDGVHINNTRNPTDPVDMGFICPGTPAGPHHVAAIMESHRETAAVNCHKTLRQDVANEVWVCQLQ